MNNKTIVKNDFYFSVPVKSRNKQFLFLYSNVDFILIFVIGMKALRYNIAARVKVHV